MLGVIWNILLNIAEGTSTNELIKILVNLSILIINLNLVERMLTHSFGMYNKSALSNAANFVFSALFIIIIVTAIVD